jgi:cardiolipin synthase
VLALQDPTTWGWVGFTLSAFGYLVAIALIPRIVLERRESGATLAWVLAILFLPWLGLLLFWAFGTQRLRWRRRRRRRAEQAIALSLDAAARPLERYERVSEPSRDCAIEEAVAALSARVAGPSTDGNATELLIDGEQTYDRMLSAIAAADAHVHAEFYIWNPDETGIRFRDALLAAAKRGVRVRVLVDDVGSRSAGRKFFAPLVRAGGKVARFLPVIFLSRRLQVNNRNHRKILVIDGRAAFTGGLNIGDEYRGVHGPWRDTHLRIEGPAALRLQRVFVEDWFHTTGEDLARPELFPESGPSGSERVQILASGPDDDRWHAIHVIVFSAIALARERVWITTPYFVPDRPLEMALETAALRGVDVRLLLPGRSDHALVLHAGRSFYPELLQAGVKIWELDQAFLHSKTVSVDGRLASVGSANMDQRSFRLNFEANAVVFGPSLARELERVFERDCERARPVNPVAFRARSRYARSAEALARILSPLL